MRRATWLGVLLLVGCTSGPTCEAAPYQDPGPYAAGVTRWDLDGLEVEVWYPADPGAVSGTPDVYDMRDWLPEDLRGSIPADAPTTFTTDAYRDTAPATDGGPYPVVVFSHGLGGYRMQSTFLMTHLAQWGFVVVAPEHAERNLAIVLAEGDLRDDSYTQIQTALAQLRIEHETAGSLLEGMVDADRLAITGHSAGGGSVQVIVDDASFGADAWVGMATVAAPETEVPGILLGGTSDAIALPEAVARVYEDVPHDRKRYLQIAGAGHLAFSDICAIGRERGGVLQIARDAGLEISDLVLTLATDGCGPEDLPVEEAWPVIRHYATAHLRAALVPEPDPPTGLEPASVACFDDRVATYESAE